MVQFARSENSDLNLSIITFIVFLPLDNQTNDWRIPEDQGIYDSV